MRAFPLLIVALAAQLLQAQDELLPVFRFQRLAGLSSEVTRSRVVRDREGFVWVGTFSALDRHDSHGVKEYRSDPADPHSISSNPVGDLLVDSKGRLWVGTRASGISLYDRLHDRFLNFVPRPGDSSWYDAKVVISLSEDRSGNIWVSSAYGGIVRVELPPGDAGDLDSLARGIHFTTYHLGTPTNTAWGMLERDDGQVLVATDSGLIVLNPATHAISRLHMADPLGRRLDFLYIHSILRDHSGNLWIGTGSEGLFRINGDGGTVTNLRHRKGNMHSLRSDLVYGLVEDRKGNLWVGTDQGIDLLSDSSGKHIPYLTIGPAPQWNKEWARISLDREGVLWVATMEGGVYWLSPKTQRFPLFGLRSEDGRSPVPFTCVDRDRSGRTWFMSSGGVLHQIDILTGKVLRRIDVFQGKKPSTGLCGSLVDPRGIYWYGAWELGLFRIDLDRGLVTNYRGNSILGSELVVNSIAQGPGDTLWIGAYHDGLMVFTPSSGRFTRVPGLPAGDVFTAIRDREGKIWMCSEQNGVTVFDPAAGSIAQFRHDPANPRSLANDRVHYAYEDPWGRVWVGGSNAVNLWDPMTRSFTRYSSPAFKNLLFMDPLGTDRKGRLWIDLTVAGTAVLEPSTGTFTEFDRTDGIRGGLFTNLSDGRVAMASANGVNIFNLDSIDAHRAPPSLVITRFWIDDEPVPAPRFSGGPCTLALRHWQNVLEFEFAALDLDAPQRVEYRYQLEGLDKGWSTPKGRLFVRYPSLSPGDYVFRVNAASSRAEWTPQEIALSIRIAPPWWRTFWAYAVYGLLFAALVYGGYRLRMGQMRLKQAAEMEHFHAEHLAEVDRLKSRFFSNISHEFRTPLTLILGPADQALAGIEDPHTRQKLVLIKENAGKLLALVNQLLDFSRLESGMVQLHVAAGDIVQFLRRAVMSFESWAERKQIALTFHADVQSSTGFFDSDKLGKIVDNLLSNALKFTGEGGAVTVRVTDSGKRSQEINTQNAMSRDGIAVSISDTGPGISPAHLPHIFERFYRVDDTHATEGTGIGLALTKELVGLHHGTITAESSGGMGSTFTFEIPTDKGSYSSEELSEPVERSEVNEPLRPRHTPVVQEVSTPAPATEARPLVLVVEDNGDLSAYLREYLQMDYTVEEARNGRLGVERALQIIPDIVVSDVMMPEMDGLELCRALKHDMRTSHIPVILLTARADSLSKIGGLEIGADDYVTKPFDSKELLARVRNLLEQRRLLRERFAASTVLRPGDVAVTSPDDAFLKKVADAVDRNMGDEDFGVDALARETCLSRAQLNRKLRAVTDISPGEFIRYMRLQRGRDLIEKHAGSIAEIAYQVGFGSPSYFAACFHERFGILPSEVRDKRVPSTSR